MSYSAFTLYLKPRMLVLLLLGFVSGLPLALTASTLSAWLSEAGVDIKTIGLFALVGLPYTLKFLWSPLVDSLPIPFLSARVGRRRAWLVVSELVLMASLVALAYTHPAENALATAVVALIVAVASATQDIVIDAYRVEVLPQEEQGAGAATSVLGYRLGMIASTAGALYLATYTDWQTTYLIMAALVPVGALTVWLAGEPAVEKTDGSAHNFAEWVMQSVVAPFRDFTTREGWLLILLFILFYKLGDAFLGNMTNPFLLEIGFSKEEIATVVKFYGIIATIIGSFIGGVLVYRYGVINPLWICGAFHALTNLMFVVQAKVGADIHVLAASITLENITGGMSTAAFVAFISQLCNRRYTATQFALLSSLAAVGRTVFAAQSGRFVEWLGWEGFFVLAVFLAFPSLVILYYLQRGKLPGRL